MYILHIVPRRVSFTYVGPKTLARFESLKSSPKIQQPYFAPFLFKNIEMFVRVCKLDKHTIWQTYKILWTCVILNF